MSPGVTRAVTDSRAWMQQGTVLFGAALARLGDDDLGAPSALPQWDRRHLVAHVAANADALRNLVRWARTGVPTPMYASPADREQGIARGAQLPPVALRQWVAESARRLAEDLDQLDDAQWTATVRTAQGRPVPGTEIPWLRAREVMVHVVDLSAGVRFVDLPEAFLAALVDDIVTKRAGSTGPAVDLSDGARTWTLPGTGEPAQVHGRLPALAAYLAGREGSQLEGLVTADRRPAPALPPWL